MSATRDLNRQLERAREHLAKIAGDVVHARTVRLVRSRAITYQAALRRVLAEDAELKANYCGQLLTDNQRRQA